MGKRARLGKGGTRRARTEKGAAHMCGVGCREAQAAGSAERAAHILAAFAGWPQLRPLQAVKIGGNLPRQLIFRHPSNGDGCRRKSAKGPVRCSTPRIAVEMLNHSVLNLPTPIFHLIDSRVHRFDRDIGFLQAEDDQAMIERNEATAQAYARRRQQVEKRKAHHSTVDRWAMFERWVLDRMAGEPYALFLKKCEVLEGPLRFEAPPIGLVVTYMDTLRNDPGGVFQNARAGTIKSYLGGISSVCHEFGISSSPVSADAVSKQLKQWKGLDGEEQSAAFDMEADLKSMWSANFTHPGASTFTRIETYRISVIRRSRALHSGVVLNSRTAYSMTHVTYIHAYSYACAKGTGELWG